MHLSEIIFVVLYIDILYVISTGIPYGEFSREYLENGQYAPVSATGPTKHQKKKFSANTSRPGLGVHYLGNASYLLPV